MSHAFFRSIFRVLPLLLVLSPVNSSSCTMGNKTAEIRVKYENILSHDIDELVNMSAEYRDRCCKNKKHEHSKVFFCNDTQEIESLQSMACNMLKFFNKQKISKEFRWKAALVSCGTLQVLQCKCERHKKEKVSGSDGLQFTGSTWLTPQSSSAQIITSTSQRFARR
ncbi:interleukin-7-like isoform X2 [Cygnus olor]|uniref:interleukin-7-like isoform X2 n=1 Tax=Cygnus atratus TaxID=8868 RepID=UPI0015D5FC1C|nr:interleukin-7-like isoform X2 [Cygnus atratus]XP_040402057.1 interleukin-7-like isoform X2 [Cygnus olor]